jgi:hypothetical protein
MYQHLLKAFSAIFHLFPASRGQKLSKCKHIALLLFGAAFVCEIIARGAKVIATGRKAETRLAHPKGTGASILDLDVTSSQADL